MAINHWYFIVHRYSVFAYLNNFGFRFYFCLVSSLCRDRLILMASQYIWINFDVDKGEMTNFVATYRWWSPLRKHINSHLLIFSHLHHQVLFLKRLQWLLLLPTIILFNFFHECCSVCCCCCFLLSNSMQAIFFVKVFFRAIIVCNLSHVFPFLFFLVYVFFLQQ
jgi:hypothetical protein